MLKLGTALGLGLVVSSCMSNSSSRLNDVESDGVSYLLYMQSVEFDARSKEVMTKVGHDLNSICFKRVEEGTSGSVSLRLYYSPCAAVELRDREKVANDNYSVFTLSKADEKNPSLESVSAAGQKIASLRMNPRAAQATTDSYTLESLCRGDFSANCTIVKPSKPYLFAMSVKGTASTSTPTTYSRSPFYYLRNFAQNSIFGIKDNPAKACDLFLDKALDIPKSGVTPQTFSVRRVTTTMATGCEQPGTELAVTCTSGQEGKCKVGDQEIIFDHFTDTITFEGKTYSRRPAGVKFITETVK